MTQFEPNPIKDSWTSASAPASHNFDVLALMHTTMKNAFQTDQTDSAMVNAFPLLQSYPKGGTIEFTDPFEKILRRTSDPMKNQFEESWKNAIKKAKEKVLEHIPPEKIDLKALDKVEKIFGKLGDRIAKGSLSADDIKDFQSSLKDLKLDEKTAREAEFFANRLDVQTRNDLGVSVKLRVSDDGSKTLLFGESTAQRNYFQIALSENSVEAYHSYLGFGGRDTTATDADGKKITVNSIMSMIKPK